MEAVSISDFGFSYALDHENVFSQIDMHVEEGAFCLLTGESGSGKTTLMKCMCPALAPTGDRTGSIKIFGEYIDSIRNASIVGYVYQDPDAQIVCDKVWHELSFGLENLGMESSLMHRRVAEVATCFGLGPIFNRDCESLSGGQKQALNVASVIAMSPRLLLLDEPTSQLDPISSQRLVDMMARINRVFGITVIVSTHSPEQFEDIATCVYELHDGRVREVDTGKLTHGPIEGGPYYMHALGNDGEPGLLKAISLKDVTFSYSEEDSCVIRHLSLDVCKGEIVSLVGANASGKTTLLKIIAGVLKVQSGNVENASRGSQAYIPQDTKLLFSKDRVLDELMEWSGGANYSFEDAMGLASKFGIVPYLETNPLDMSAGQQQKLGIAKMLLCRPELLLLDEPTKGLDGKSQFEIAKILIDAADAGATIVIATHDLAFASRISNSLALVFDGEIACAQDSSSFCKGNLFYLPSVTHFSRLWDASHGAEDFQ